MEIKNERGYALVTVLLIATILMIIVISAMGQSFNTLKQNQTLEKKSQSTAIAEMGVSYYQAMVQNIYTDPINRNTVFNKVQTQINNDRNSNTLKQNDAEYNPIASKAMIDIIKEKLLIEANKPPKPIPNSNSSFKVNVISSTDNSITIEITGFTNGESIGTPLRTTMTVSPKVVVFRENNESTPIISINLSLKLQDPPNSDSKCEQGLLGSILSNLLSIDLDKLLKDATCKDIIVESDLTINHNSNSLDGNLLYAEGNLLLSQNANNMTTVTLHSNEDLRIEQNLQNALGVTIEANGTIKLDQNVDISKYVPSDSTKPVIYSYLYAGDNLDTDQHLGLLNGTTAYVGGWLKAKDVTLTNGSKVYVGANITTADQSLTTDAVDISGGSILSIGGKATISGKLRIDSNLDSLLCISARANLAIDSSNIILEDNQPDKHIVTLDSDINLRNKCGFNTSKTNSVTWDDKISNIVDYEY